MAHSTAPNSTSLTDQGSDHRLSWWHYLGTWGRRHASLLAVVACLTVLVSGLIYYVHGYMRAGQYWIPNTDYRVFYAAAVAVRHHADPFAPTIAWMHQYTPTSHLGTLFATKSYAYPPFFALLQVPFTWLPLLQAAILWDLCNVAFLIGAIYALLRIANIRPSLLTMFVLTTAALLTDPIRKELFVAQTDIFLLFLICVSLAARYGQKARLAGVLLGVACAIKPPLLLWVAFLLWKREFRFTATAVVTFLVLFCAPFLWLGGQVWHDQLAVFHFWSTQYLAYDHNDSPKGVLVRLFTSNPVVRPLVAAPALVTPLWLVVIAVVLVLTLAAISPRPLQRDTRSLLEIGLVVPAMLLVSPLTEWPYLLMFAIPLLALYSWLYSVDWQSPPFRIVTLGGLAIWLLLCGPLSTTEKFFTTRMVLQHSRVADLYVILAPGYLYLLIAMFALQLYAVRLVSGQPTRMAVRHVVVNLPVLVQQLMYDAGSALASYAPIRR